MTETQQQTLPVSGGLAWEASPSKRPRREKSPTSGVALTLTILVVALGAASVVLLFLGDSLPIRDRGQFQLIISLAVICAGGLLIRLTLANRRSWQRALTELRARIELELESTAADLRAELEDKAVREEDLIRQREHSREQIAVLTQTSAALHEELNRVRQEQKSLAGQRQELARTKNVLELHVQARTQELEKLRRRYELILNSAGEGICGLNAEGQISFVNPAAARIMGASVAQMIGLPARALFPTELPGDAAEAATEWPRETLWNRADGSRFVAEYVRSPICEGERLVGEVLLFKDISERKKAEDTLAQKAEELARSNAELEQFAFVASHDLQEPLRKIQAFGDRLKTKCDAAKLEDGRDYLDRMQNATARMQTLIQDLLTFSRVISRTEPFVPVDLTTLTREVLSDLEVRIRKTNATVEVSELMTLEADPTQLWQLLQNLIGNALKFHTPGSRPVVRINGRLAGAVDADSGADVPFYELSIQDNGIGFDEKYMDKIFAVFQRLHGRTEYEGTGIGLAVCRRIVDRHGGTITAHSKPGKGATFIVTLPVRQLPRRKKAE